MEDKRNNIIPRICHGGVANKAIDFSPIVAPYARQGIVSEFLFMRFFVSKNAFFIWQSRENPWSMSDWIVTTFYACFVLVWFSDPRFVKYLSMTLRVTWRHASVCRHCIHCLLFLFQAGISAAPARAVSAVKEMNIPQKIKDIKLPDLPSIGNLKF